MRPYVLAGLIAGCSSPVKPTAPPPPPPPPPPPAPAVAHQTVAATTRAELEAMLGFEDSPAGEAPKRWTTKPPGTIVVDATVVHTGHGAVRIERTATTAGPFSTVTNQIPIDFSGTTVELRGYLRTEDVKRNTGLWLREDGEGTPVQFT